jgi:hypothetical protein
MLADFMLNDFAEGAKHLKIYKILLDHFPFNFNRYTNSLSIRWQIIFSILYVVNILKKTLSHLIVTLESGEKLTTGLETQNSDYSFS